MRARRTTKAGKNCSRRCLHDYSVDRERHRDAESFRLCSATNFPLHWRRKSQSPQSIGRIAKALPVVVEQIKINLGVGDLEVRNRGESVVMLRVQSPAAAALRAAHRGGAARVTPPRRAKPCSPLRRCARDVQMLSRAEADAAIAGDARGELRGRSLRRRTSSTPLSTLAARWPSRPQSYRCDRDREPELAGISRLAGRPRYPQAVRVKRSLCPQAASSSAPRPAVPSMRPTAGRRVARWPTTAGVAADPAP